MEFHTLALGSGWNESAVQQGLNQEVLTELACRDDNITGLPDQPHHWFGPLHL